MGSLKGRLRRLERRGSGGRCPECGLPPNGHGRMAVIYEEHPEKGFDGTTDLYVVTNKNFSRADPMRLASYVEAQLIPAFSYVDISPKSLGTDLAKKNQVGSGPFNRVSRDESSAPSVIPTSPSRYSTRRLIRGWISEREACM